MQKNMGQGEIIGTLWGIKFTWEGIGILIAAIFSSLSFLGSIIRFLYEKKKVSIQYITQKKMDWITAICDESAQYASTVMDLCMKIEITDIDLKALLKEEYILRLYLSQNVEQDIQVKAILKKMREIRNGLHDAKFNRVNQLCEDFIKEMCRYLNEEWKKVRMEVH